MKRISSILSLLVVFFTLNSCQKKEVPLAGFKDVEVNSIYDYLMQNEAEYSSFIQILKAAGMDKTLSAYNPGGKTKGVGYTLFLPTNQAVDEFIKNSNEYSSLDDLLNDTKFVSALARYHVLNKKVASNEFPFGTFDQPNLTNDFLNVVFDITTADTTIYLINGQAPVVKPNIKNSNGYIQVIGKVLIPITENSYGWLKKNASYSIFTAALNATEVNKVIDVDMKLENQTLNPFTMLVEADSIYNKKGIMSFDDLANVISPGRTDYTSTNNPLYLFVTYHILNGSLFLDDLAAAATNYNTFADIPLTINGLGMDIVINKGKEIFVDEKQDSTDFITIFYDASNVNTQSGAIHFINQIMRPQAPTRAEVGYQLGDDRFIDRYRIVPGTYEIEDHNLLSNITWTGESKLFYYKSNDATEVAWSKDYMAIIGDFTITYNSPKVIPGKYEVFIGANFYNQNNALIEIMIDGNKVGGLVDLTTGGSSTMPYYNWDGYKIGTVDFKKYDRHTILVKSLIPGIFIWDYIKFRPI